jgi:hypothetical protein
MVEEPAPERSSRERKGKSKVISDPIFRGPPPAVPMPPGMDDMPYRTREPPSFSRDYANARGYKQAKQEDDIVMVDAGGPSENPPGLRRTDSSAKRASLGGMFGGLLGSKSRPDNKRRNTAATDDEGVRALRREDRKIKRPTRERSSTMDRDITMSGGAAEEDQEARRAARHARKADREALDRVAEDSRKAKDEERRERRKKQEEQEEARKQEEREARRAARREQKAREDADRQAAEAKEARRRARRTEKESAQTDGEPLTEDPERRRKSDRRKSHMDTPGEDEERRRRREERRATRAGGSTPKTSRRKSAPVPEDYFDSRNGHKSRDAEYMPADGPVYKDAKRKKEKPGWPHSGTDSWVKDHSDAPPPPEASAEGNEKDGDDSGRRRKSRRQSKYGDEDPEERRRRRESRRGGDKATVKSGEGSQAERRSSRRDSGFVETTPSRGPSASGGLFSRWKKIAGV